MYLEHFSYIVLYRAQIVRFY